MNDQKLIFERYQKKLLKEDDEPYESVYFGDEEPTNLEDIGYWEILTTNLGEEIRDIEDDKILVSAEQADNILERANDKLREFIKILEQLYDPNLKKISKTGDIETAVDLQNI